MVINNVFLMRLESTSKMAWQKEIAASNQTVLRRGSQWVGMTVDNIVCPNSKRFKFKKESPSSFMSKSQIN